MISMNQDVNSIDECPRFYLNPQQVKALGILDHLHAGTEISLTALACVESITESLTNAVSISMHLKITDMNVQLINEIKGAELYE